MVEQSFSMVFLSVLFGVFFSVVLLTMVLRVISRTVSTALQILLWPSLLKYWGMETPVLMPLSIYSVRKVFGFDLSIPTSQETLSRRLNALFWLTVLAMRLFSCATSDWTMVRIVSVFMILGLIPFAVYQCVTTTAPSREITTDCSILTSQSQFQTVSLWRTLWITSQEV